MLDYSDFCKLIERDKESLIALIGDLIMQIEELKAEKPISLPELPAVGQYVIRDAHGGVRAVAPEDQFLIDQVEGMAILFSLEGYAAIQFCLGDRAQLMSEWSNGKRISRCQ